MVGRAQLFEHHQPDLFGRDFFLAAAEEVFLDLIRHGRELLGADRPLVRRRADALNHFVARIRNPAAVLLHHEQRDFFLDLLVGREPLVTRLAHPTPTDRPAPVGRAGVDHLVIINIAERTTHSLLLASNGDQE